MQMLVIGVDPGGQETGIVLRDGNEVITGILLRRLRSDSLTDYLAEHVRCLKDLRSTYGDDIAIVCETITVPSPHVRVIAVQGLLDTQFLIGGLCVAFPGLILVEPSGHGSQPLFSYPSSLVGPRERVGAGRFRHLRSAFDVGAASYVLVGNGR